MCSHAWSTQANGFLPVNSSSSCSGTHHLIAFLQASVWFLVYIVQYSNPVSQWTSLDSSYIRRTHLEFNPCLMGRFLVCPLMYHWWWSVFSIACRSDLPIKCFSVFHYVVIFFFCFCVPDGTLGIIGKRHMCNMHLIPLDIDHVRDVHWFLLFSEFANWCYAVL